MHEPNGSCGGKARGWPYVVTGVLFAGICAWISYNDGLFVARLAGNHDALAYFYPLLPDGLIVLCLLALAEAARAGVGRSRWAVAGLLLGIALTLAMNTYAGVEHSVLDAVLDGMVPVVFFIAAEVVLWHVRHNRRPAQQEPGTASAGASVPASLPSLRQLQAKHGCGQATARKIRAELAAFDRGRGNSDPTTRAPATQRSRDGGVSPAPRAVPAASLPAGVALAPPAPAGAGPQPELNGQASHG